MAEPEVVKNDGPAKPIFLRYPDFKAEVRLGEGVYFHPVVKVETPGMDSEEEKKNFEDFMEIAQSVTNCFAGENSEVKLDPVFCQEVWDASAGEADPAFRVDWAVNELCDILEKTPVVGLGAGVELLDQEIWRSAKRVLCTQLMNHGVSKGLNFSTDPALPAGLMIAESTGIISGHPTVASVKQSYKVVCKSELGSAECKIELECVEAAAPQKVEYKAERVYLCGQPMVIMPKVTGLVTTWTVKPNLPKGLRLDNITGTVCGIPQEATDSTTWTVIAKNELGSATAKISFEIVQAAPSNLQYHADENTSFASNRLGFCGRQAVQTFPVNRWMCLRPTVDGNVDKYEVRPPFPNGVNIDPETGVISGTPTVETPTTPYTIVATNAGGSGKVMISFAIKNLPTIGVSYPTFDDVYCVGEQVECDPLVQGGATTWAVEPALPTGMVMDPKTGRITGCCTEPVDEQSYTVTASNEVGGTSCVLTFMVIAMPPDGLSYLEMLSEYFVGEEVSVEPDLLCGAGNVDFFVQPKLPAGLAVHKDKGTIMGTPTEEAEMTAYKIDAENTMGKSSCVVEFRVKKKPEPASQKRPSVLGGAPSAPAKRAASQGMPTLAEGNEEEEADSEVKKKATQVSPKEDFAQKLQNVEAVKDLPAEPDKVKDSWNWMLWAVHRAWLNDPALTTLSFKGLDIPLPDVEPRIAGKLIQAMAMNRTIISMDLSACNLRGPHAKGLAQALRKNQTLQILNVDGNWLESSHVEAIVDALTQNESSKLTALLCNDQQGVEDFGKSTEQKVADMMEKNMKITKLTIPIEDPHWKSIVDRCLKRNLDATKRAAKQTMGVKAGTATVQERTLASLAMVKAPTSSANDIFKAADEQIALARLFTSEKKRLPTKDQLQLFAKNRGQPLKYSDVAPVVKAFRKALLDALIGSDVLIVDSTHKKTEGPLKSWSEKNERWTVDMESEGTAYRFTLSKEPILEVSDKVAEWLVVSAAPPAKE